MTQLLPAPVQAVIDATNRGDVDAFLDAFTDDGVVDDWGREFTGRTEIRGWSDREYVGKQVSLQVDRVEVVGGETIVGATVGGNGFNGPSTFTFATTEDRVTRMTIRE
ncbi:nuclear transport factor 2 family protein [Skermania sp. ID1734]|uniref:nuclear transport factor 2 family protein n=1 Tax=Skermania sp. ID1734 TaxID=2597516 RepID=UPI001180EABA|nr:nuclear transport factor 2 family protein [Skermania sp. ID1734]TSD94077.1 nuclear transport factor 2 family protein [Skermania sp. ID1734]